MVFNCSHAPRGSLAPIAPANRIKSPRRRSTFKSDKMSSIPRSGTFATTRVSPSTATRSTSTPRPVTAPSLVPHHHPTLLTTSNPTSTEMTRRWLMASTNEPQESPCGSPHQTSQIKPIKALAAQKYRCPCPSPCSYPSQSAQTSPPQNSACNRPTCPT